LSREFTSAAGLSEKGLLSPAELERFKTDRRFPPNFGERVLDRFERAVPINRADSILTHDVFWVDEFYGPTPPVLAYDGSPPRDFTPRRIPRHPVVIHDVRDAQIFVGYRSTTLLLNSHHYFEGVSSPNSNWITRAFAGVAPDMTVDGTAAILFANGASLYSHWMFDLLPKFEVLRRAGWTDDKVDYYIVNSTRARYCDETLTRLGISRDKIISANGQLIRAERLLVPSSVRRGFWTPNWVTDFLVANFLLVPDPEDSLPADQRFYISRANAGRRRVANEEEVRAFLEQRGFRTLFAEEIGVCRSAALIRSAGIIVAPHGAGVTNVVFARPGVRVLEFFGAHIAPEGWLMTKTIGGEHFLLAGRDQAGRNPWQSGFCENLSPNERNAADYVIDIDDLSRALYMVETYSMPHRAMD